jgi:hypothetical protein
MVFNNIKWTVGGTSSGGSGRTTTGTVPGNIWNQSGAKEPDPPAATPPKVVNPPNPRQAAGISLPDSQEGIVIPYVAGTVRVDSNILWYGNADTEESTTEYTGPTGETLTSIVYRDTIDVQFGLCTGPGVHLRAIYGENDSIIWTGNVGPNETDFTTGLTAGLFSGDLTFYGGEFNQPINGTLYESIIGQPVPAFVGTSYIMLVNGDRANTKPFSFEIQRMPNPLSLAAGVNASADGKDINAISIAIDLLTSKWNGAGNDISGFDVASFIASATTLASEDNFCSIAINDDSITAEDVITMIEQQIDGTIFIDPSTGLVTCRLFREASVDLDDTSLIVFDYDKIQGHPNWSKVGWNSASQLVRIMYADRSAAYAELPAIAQTIDVVASGGRANFPKQITYPLVTTAARAAVFAAKELARLSAPRYSMTMTVDREGALLLPGDVILVDYPIFKLDRTPFFVMRRTDKTSEDNTVDLELAQFSFPNNNAIFPPPEDSGYFAEVRDPLAPSAVQIIDLPFRLSARKSGAEGGGAFSRYVSPYENVAIPMALATPASRYQLGWYMRYDQSYSSDQTYMVGPPIDESNIISGAGDVSGVTIGAYCAVGTLQTAIDEFDGITTGEVPVVVIDDLFRPAFGPPMFGTGNQYFLIDEEFFYCEPTRGLFGITNPTTGALVGNTLTMAHLRRSRLDTVKASHSIGATVYIFTLLQQGSYSGPTFSPGLKVDVSDLMGSPSPFPSFRFNGKSYFDGEASPGISADTLESIEYAPGERIIRPLRPHNTRIGANARSSVPVNLTRGATETIHWKIRSRWQTGYFRDDGGSPSPGSFAASPWLGWPTPDYDFEDIRNEYSEYDASTSKYVQYRVMIKDSADVVWDLGNTADNVKDANDLLVTWPVGAAAGSGLLWVEAYNDYSDSSRFKDTLPINLV